MSSGNELIDDAENSLMYTGVKNERILPINNPEGSHNGNDCKRNLKQEIRGKYAVNIQKRELQCFDRKNFILHQHFIRRDFSACKALIKEMSDDYKCMSEYPFYVRGKIARIEGNFREALYWFEKARSLNPMNCTYLREIGRLHFLLGNHVKAAEIFLDAIKLDGKEWKLYYWRALALYHIKQDSDSVLKAQECLIAAPSETIQRAEILTFMAKLFEQRNDIKPAIEAQKKALELEPENIDVLANMGQLYVRWQNDDQAFDAFGKALSYDPTHPQSILGAGSIIQTNGEYDTALSKYRMAVEKCEYNGPLWNNIGMCFFGKGKYLAALSCLKKALYLCPLEWKICYNLGIVHNAMEQYASAYHFLSSAVNLNTRSAMAFMALAVVLTNLDDIFNAKKAYEKALQIDKNNNVLLHLNYAIFQAKQNEFEKSMESLNTFYQVYHSNQQPSQEMVVMANQLKCYLTKAMKNKKCTDDYCVPR